MKQPEIFSSSKGEHLVCKLKKSIYSLKQAPLLVKVSIWCVNLRNLYMA